MDAAWNYIERTVSAAYQAGNLSELLVLVGGGVVVVLAAIFGR